MIKRCQKINFFLVVTIFLFLSSHSWAKSPECTSYSCTSGQWVEFLKENGNLGKKPLRSLEVENMTLSLLNFHQNEGQFRLLFKVKKDADIGYFTISLSHNPDELYAERKGEQIDLSQISTDKNMVVNQQAALGVLFFMLTEPLLEIPQDIQAINFDRVELLLYRLLTNTNQPQSKEDVKNALLNLLKKKSQPSSKNPSLKKRIEAHKTFSFPMLSNLTVEIMEDDLFLTLYGYLLGEKSKATAKYDNSSAKKRRIIISRSS